MLYANELRLGNLVNQRTTKGWQPVLVDLETLSTLPRSGDAFEFMGIKPIELTVEILEKANLHYNDDIDDIKGWEIKPGVYLSRLDKNGWYVGYEIEDNSRWHSLGQITETFKYLHQFQNLYFALTGTELPVNL
jgi:hypothetical protein